MYKKTILLLAVSLTLLASGCLFSSYKPISDFELDLEPVKGNGKVCVSMMRNTSSSGMRIQSRAYSELLRDPYNLWAMEPGVLVTTALNRALCKDNVEPVIVFFGEIDCFEADIPGKVFRFSGFYSLRKSRNKVRFDITSPLPGNTPGNIALAASEAVRLLALRMAETGKNLK